MKIISFRSIVAIPLLLMILVLPMKTFAQSFSDISKSHLQYNAIESLKNLNIVKGYDDGNFKPEKSVNRVEALKMILLSAKIDVPTSVEENPFSDVPSDQWFSGLVKKAKDQKIVSGDGKTGKFLPARTVKKAEFLKMLLLSFGKDVSKHNNKKGVSKDVSSDAWFVAYLSYAKTLNIISPDKNGNLHPQKTLSRGECAEIVYKLLILEKGGNTQKLLSITESSLISTMLDISRNDIASARINIDKAVSYASLALKDSPNSGVVKAAKEVSLAMNDLVHAYESGLSNNKDALKKFANSAKDRAGKAYEYNSSTQPLGKKIKQYADSLLGQL